MLYNTDKSLLDYLKQNPLILAPMAGVTDTPFRSFMKRMGVGIVITELVSATGLVRSQSDRTRSIAAFSEDQRPIGIQIFGEDPDILSQAARIVENMGASFVDLNLGCPVTKIIKRGAGSAMLKDLSLLSKVLKSIKKNINIPFTIKIRTGWDESKRNSEEVARVAYNEGCLWVAIHGRTRSQGYSGLADWNYIAEVKSKSQIPIIGNGDLIHPKQIQDIYNQTHCDGLMIGRGCLKNPWIFLESYKLLNGQSYEKRAYVEILNELFSDLESFYDERMSLIQFKKLSTWLSSGLPESSLFRKDIFQLKDRSDVLKYVLNYFEKWSDAEKESIEYEPFLLQGHG